MIRSENNAHDIDKALLDMLGPSGLVSLGDNNIHVGISAGPEIHAVEQEIATIVHKSLPSRPAGSISAEHGIGQHKKDFLRAYRSRAKMEVIQKLRGLLDPGRLINREVLC